MPFFPNICFSNSYFPLEDCILSRYFLKKDDILVHGAQIFAGYLADKDLAEEIEKKGLARKLFTFQFAEDAVRSMFNDYAELIMQKFVKMLTFDAIVGNNDRHFYNWGVITRLENRKNPTFAPIYDTARGLYWNENEEAILTYLRDPKSIQTRISKYIANSKPKTGWEGIDDPNHFQLIEKIYQADDRYKGIIFELLKEENYRRMACLIDEEFVYLLSKERRKMMALCLEMRWQKLNEII